MIAERDSQFLSTIQRIFDDSCIECHGPDSAEGDVRLDTLDPDAGAVSWGDPDASEIIYRIELPHDDEDAMPPRTRGKR